MCTLCIEVYLGEIRESSWPPLKISGSPILRATLSSLPWLHSWLTCSRTEPQPGSSTSCLPWLVLVLIPCFTSMSRGSVAPMQLVYWLLDGVGLADYSGCGAFRVKYSVWLVIESLIHSAFTLLENKFLCWILDYIYCNNIKSFWKLCKLASHFIIFFDLNLNFRVICLEHW